MDVFDLSVAVFDLHPKDGTFPGEVFMHLGAETMEIAGVTREEPLPYEGLLETYLSGKASPCPSWLPGSLITSA